MEASHYTFYFACWDATSEAVCHGYDILKVIQEGDGPPKDITMDVLKSLPRWVWPPKIWRNAKGKRICRGCSRTDLKVHLTDQEARIWCCYCGWEQRMTLTAWRTIHELEKERLYR